MSKYSDETKAAALAALLAGQSVSEVAKEYKIPRGTLRSWKSRQTNGDSVATVATDKKIEVGEMLVEYLRANLAALKAQVVVFSDPDWLRKQNAADAAVLHGVMTDKAVRLLEAFGKADDSDTDAND